MSGPTFKYGDMFTEWNKPDTLFLVTTNNTVDFKGELVMGAGAAKALKLRARRLPRIFGESVKSNPDYGLLVFEADRLKKRLGHWCQIFCSVGAFQVKRDFRKPALTQLIEKASGMLVDWASKHPTTQIHLNMPGTGAGRLAEAHVMPLIQGLPANVNVWRFEHEVPA